MVRIYVQLATGYAVIRDIAVAVLTLSFIVSLMEIVKVIKVDSKLLLISSVALS